MVDSIGPQDSYEGGARRTAAGPMTREPSPHTITPNKVRDFIPEGEEKTEEEKARFVFGRDPGAITPDFVPDPERKNIFPIGDAQAQMDDAKRAVKQRTTAHDEEQEAKDRVKTLEDKNVAEAIDFIQSQSDQDKALYIEAERQGKNRKTVLRELGAE